MSASPQNLCPSFQPLHHHEQDQRAVNPRREPPSFSHLGLGCGSVFQHDNDPKHPYGKKTYGYILQNIMQYKIHNVFIYGIW